ncbi:type II secretion system secretin GspD [Uliginosibacterium sp. 31-12]|uniref:type II secretion system secretin GspD n=1 Tax=Uliginosibacterium sp. 31-12 TaxID=3062781 RepID=UPI0026E224CA|nr:type II secretion system secretin GspD [Uliginosibacterium sp. 31-12]MDO6386002.1 type II secretion system secretin GspD [Uliginosibacterium sp. 31-12]
MKIKTIAAATLLCFALSAHAADERVTLNFVNSDLEATLKAVTVITGKSFVIDPKLKGTVNIVSNQPVDRNLVLPIVQSALRQQGITLIDNGTVVKVLAEGDAKQHGSQIVGKGAIPTGDRFVTQVYPLRYESATQLAQVLRPMLGNNSVIAAYQAGNVLVINDYAENLSRINRLLEHLDQPSGTNVFQIPVKHASVQDVAQNLARLMPEVVLQGTAAPVPVPDGVKRVMLITDTRSSQLIVRSDSTAHTEQVKRIVDMLDQPGATGSAMNVIYLRNAEATRLATTLRGILTGQDSGGTNSSLSGGGSSGSSGSSTGSSASTTAASSGVQSGQSTGNTATSVKIDGVNVMIQADAVTNSLIITAPDKIYRDIRAIIEKLDVRRAQVYVEAMIAEVNVSKTGEFGFQWMVAGGNNNLTGGLISSISGGANSIATIANGLIAGSATVPEGVNIGVFNGDPTNGTATLGLLATAIQKSGDGNVLSTPNLQTLDNEEARIVVGQNIPIITGTQSSTGSNQNPFTTVERRDIGIKLKIKPQISEAGAITLNVAQEVSSIDTSVNTSGTGIATKVRTIETKVLVDDGQIVVLGGLIDDRQSTTDNGIPILMDIPYLGNLFRYRTRERQKVNLMVFLRPVILRDSTANNNLANERYAYLRARQAEYSPESSWVLPNFPNTQLPERDSLVKGKGLDPDRTVPATNIPAPASEALQAAPSAPAEAPKAP